MFERKKSINSFKKNDIIIAPTLKSLIYINQQLLSFPQSYEIIILLTECVSSQEQLYTIILKDQAVCDVLVDL